MSKKKKISNYYKEQEKLRKKKQNEKRLTIVLITLIVVLAIVIGAVAVSLLIKPDPIKVALEVKDYGTIVLELYPDVAPKSVKNFVNYVEDGFYDGLKFHRVIEDFMIQGGDPEGTGSGGQSLPKIKGEFKQNGFKNDLSFKRGVIGMARGQAYDSASSQFFICHKDSPHLNGAYAAFGKVIEGIEVVDKIATCEKTDVTDSSGSKYIPATDVIITRAYVVE